jgi:DNA-binding response OmpR family regulator
LRLLVIEDEPTLARHLLRGLREEGYAVDLAETLAEASELSFAAEYDLAVLDLMLPDGNGLRLLRFWRDHGKHLPVLVLTARDAVEDRVEGLDSGADDYLNKPFRFEELLARIRSLLRRRGEPIAARLELGELSLDRDAKTATVHGQALQLTAKETALLEYFLLHPRRILSRSTIAEHVWDQSQESDSNVIDVLVSRLRRKIREAGGRELLQTVKGLGYVLREPAAEET